MVPQAGQRVGPYEVLDRLGIGGMGVVFRAWDHRLQREVAIKMLRPEFSTPDMRARFLQEARAVSSLTHPHICTIYDIGAHDGEPFLVMELLRGETLRARMERQPLTPAEIVRLAEEAADALGAAHRLGVVHRDIKPANIFLTTRPSGGFSTKILDFGLAQIESPLESKLEPQHGFDRAAPRSGPSAARQGLSEDRSALGTVGYMSPEQARGEEIDARSDLFSLGVVLYEAATGEPPFRGITHALTFVQLLSHAPDPVRLHNPEISPALDDVLLRLLEKDRNYRFANAAALRLALSAAGQHRENGVPLRLWQGATRVLRRSHPASGGPAGRRASPSAAASDPVARRPLTTHLRLARPAPKPAGAGAKSAGRPSAAAGEATLRSEEGIDRGPDNPAPDTPASGRPFPHLAAAAVLAALVLCLASALYLRWLTQRERAAAAPRILVFAPVDNRTGDTALSDIVAEGLRLALDQSTHLAVRSREELRSGLRATGIPPTGRANPQQLRAAAGNIGGTGLLLTEIRQDGGGYTLETHVSDLASGTESAHFQETAGSRDLMLDAIDRLAMDLRGAMGESPAAVAKTAIPLRVEATASLDALTAYSTGQNSLANNAMADALGALLAAVADDPHFTQAWLSLAELYRRQHAPLAAGMSVLRAAEASRPASERLHLTAQAAVSLYATGDLPRAAALFRRILAARPQDDHSRVLLSLALRGQGRFAEAQATAAEVVAHNPWDFDATGQAEVNLLALDRPEEAERIEAEFSRSGRSHIGLLQLIHYLGSRENGERAVDLSGAGDRVAAQEYGAALLDAGGLLAAGMSGWQTIADRAAATPELLGSPADALSSAALDRALVGDCAGALEPAEAARDLPAAADALFRQGLAAALCGHDPEATAALQSLSQTGQKYAVDNFYRADLTAAIQLRAGNALGALATLDHVRGSDAVSPTAYLRGLAHLNAGQGALAADDFQIILKHPGASTLINPVLLPMAQFQLARAWAIAGDTPRSAAAYAAFLDLWHGADATLTVVREASEASASLNTGQDRQP